MRTLGIIGGVSWHSTLQYYKLLNQSVARNVGKNHSARIILNSIDFADLLTWQRDKSNKLLIDAFVAEGRKLHAAGCEAFIIASHTLGWLGEIIELETGIKHISIYDALFRKLNSLNATRVGLTGTRYTMQDSLYRERYQKAGFEVVAPDQPHLTSTAAIVYTELVHGIFLPESKKVFGECFQNLIARNADAIVLGCTEIGLLISEREWPVISSYEKKSVPVIDLIEAHVPECLSWMLST
ncbi:MAG: hypothetical protein RI953_2007 [Pseudomonadota bacterium]